MASYSQLGPNSLIANIRYKQRNTIIRHPLAKFSYTFGLVLPFAHASICRQRKISALAHRFFLIFCIEWDSHNVRKVTKLEKSLFGSKRPKVFQKWPKNEGVGEGGGLGEGGGWKKFNLFICTFLLNIIVLIVLFYPKTTRLRKIWFSSYGEKTSRPNRM